MLATFRVPITDARGLASDEALARSVMLPERWLEGDFVRGLGRVTRRAAGAVEPWAFESAYADARYAVTFPEAPLELEARAPYVRLQSIRKRAWKAVQDSSALIDLDVALQLTLGDSPDVAYPKGLTFSLNMMTDLLGAAAALPVHLRSEPAETTRPLRALGKPLAAHFAGRTSAIAEGARLVGAGRMTAVIEAPGAAVVNDAGIRCEQLAHGRIQLASLDLPVFNGPDIRCHVLWSTSRWKGDRKRLRELRIHILRLHSIFELLRFLGAPRVLESLADKRGTPGFDRLQKTLLSCVRIVRTHTAPGGTDPGGVLDTAFFSQSFVDRDLELLLDRTLGAMRLKVRREVEEFLESERRREDGDRRASELRDEREATTIVVNGDYVGGNKYTVDGTVIGPVGDNATVNGNIVAGDAKVSGNVIGGTGHTITIGSDDFSRDDLVAALQEFREKLAQAAGATPEAQAADGSLKEAEGAARAGNSGGVVAALKRVGEWVLEVSGQIGVPIATAAIKAAMGLP